MRDIANNIKLAVSLAPDSYAAPTNGDTVDLKGFESCAFVLANGDAGAGSAISVEEADDDGTGAPGAFAAVDAADLDGAFAVLVADEHQKVGYLGTKRFVRLVTDGAVAGEYAGVCVLGHPSTAPVT